jgi:two-component system response regulator CpxR
MIEKSASSGTTEPGTKSAILLVDDDAELCNLMREYFSRAGHSVECAYDGRSGLAAALSGKHDLVILDGMLPALDGLEVLRQLRKRSSIPVIMLTARTLGKDRITGLDSGADDYLPKPFLPDELFARIRAVMRRYNNTPLVKSDVLACGDLELNPITHVVRHAGDDLDITGTEFQILEILMRSPGRTVSRDEISTVLYQRESTPFERALDVHISHLRKKLEQRGMPVIRTVRGVGYMFAGEEK